MAVLGLGLAALGRPGYMTLGHAADLGDTAVSAMERHCHEVLDAACAEGIRYFDAARSYGRAEEFLASWLSRRQPPGVTVASKWGYTYTAGWRAQAEQHEVKDHSLLALRRQLAESRETLGTWLRVYQIHSVTPESPVLDDGGVLDELRRLRDQGVRIGFTVSGPRQAEVVRRALEPRLFEVVQATWNLLEPSSGPALAEAKQAGLTVVVKEAMANGRLARQAPAPLVEAARALGATPDAFALAAALSQPWADVVLSGAANADQVRQNARAAGLRVDARVLDDLRALAEEPERYWKARSQLAWT